ncbi:radical SAM protein [Candidatus Bathyarchaeota archaeon]|nr:radical SAM protein [Candidatus Bathyarchaeota archaeon]
MDADFPEVLQVEVTNRCNFNCQICIRNVWKIKALDLPLSLYRKVAEDFHRIRRLVLYGFGEPLVNPGFLEMLRIARSRLPEDGEVSISTNGSLLTPRTADKMVKEIGIDSVFFSIDAVEEAKLSSLRRGADFKAILRNLRYLTKLRDEAKRSLKIGVETVVMKDNLSDLPDLVRFLAEEDVDSILLSHVVPYTESVLRKTLYTTLSKHSLEIIEFSMKYGWRLLRDAAQGTLSQAYVGRGNSYASDVVRSLWRRAERKGYWINLPLLFLSEEAIRSAVQVERCFEKCLKVAREYQVDLNLPSVYPDAKRRSCPYVDSNATVVRSDGKVVPCLEFAYRHPMYVNAHVKDVYEVVFGDLMRESLESIWNKKVYADFRQVRRSLSENIPWCGDCPYSALGCFFTKTSELDCYSNSPGCNECLYSVGLARCNL